MSFKWGDARRPQLSARAMIEEQLLAIEPDSGFGMDTITLLGFDPFDPSEFDDFDDDFEGDGMFADDFEDYDRYYLYEDDLAFGGRW